VAKRNQSINWRVKDKKEVARVVRNFNSKLARLESKGIDIHLPQKITTQQLIEQIQTRADFNRVLNSYKRFSRRGAERERQGLNFSITEWEYQEAVIKTRVINRRKNEENKRFADIDEKTGTLTAFQQNQKLNITRFNPDNGLESWIRYVRARENQISSTYLAERDMDYVLNYYKALQDALGFTFAQDIIDVMSTMSNSTIVLHSLHNPNLTINSVYDFGNIYDTYMYLLTEWSNIANSEKKEE